MSLKIFNISEKIEYLREVIILEHNEWAENPNENFEQRIDAKIKRNLENLSQKDFCKLILLDNETLIGFISIFPIDCDEYPELTPWYATMYVKEEYRGKGYSKILNDAILDEARKRGFSKIYLKTTLKNYYEKFGAQYISTIKDNEKLYYYELN